MATSYSQKTRTARLDTPLGKDKLVLRQLHCQEGMSALFEIRVEAVATERGLDFDQAIGRNCTLAVETIEGGQRYFDGILTEVRLLEEDDEGLVYSLVLRPWLWLLSKTTNCLIFHEKKAPDIIAEIFAKHGGLARFETMLSRDYPELEYCVQYRESDLDFVRRLMEQHGIGFHFRHEQGRHTLILGDGALAYQPVPGEKRPFVAVEKRHQRRTEHVFIWTDHRTFTEGKVTLNDYDFKHPNANMTTQSSGNAKYQHGKLEIYDYPGAYDKEQAGKGYAETRLTRARAADGHFFGEGDCLSCAPGYLMTLTGHPDKSFNGKYLVLRATHHYMSQAYRSKRQIGDEGYSGNYEFMDAARPYAPEAVTSRPYLRGPQTAVVVGDREIDCDKYGRVKVQFHWDRKNDQSMRVRVAQIWASGNWGGIFIPRVGMEVIVDFLEGDPDRPIIIGSVYNGKNMPPYDLPGEKNIGGWKTNSTQGGGGYHEIAWDDTKGKELFRVHAERDLDTTVKNDERRHVKKNRETKIDVDDTHKVGKELYIEAGSKITLKVGGSTVVIDSTSITLKSMSITVDAKSNLTTKSGMVATHEATGQMTIKAAIVNIN